MSNQIFKKNIPIELLFNLLDDICIKNEKHYYLNINSFKKGVYNESIQNFFSRIFFIFTIFTLNLKIINLIYI